MARVSERWKPGPLTQPVYLSIMTDVSHERICVVMAASERSLSPISTTAAAAAAVKGDEVAAKAPRSAVSNVNLDWVSP